MASRRQRRSGPSAFLAVGLGLLLAGCVPVLHLFGPATSPHLPSGSPAWSPGIDPADGWLRHHLLLEQPGRAAELLGGRSPLRPRDDLLRDLQLGAVLHYAGRYAESDAALARAEVEAERRYTRSLLREAAAATLNENAVEFVPSPAERMMIPYFRMWNRFHLGDAEGAVVEARRAAAFLQELDPDSDDACDHLFLEWMAAFVFEYGGEWNDALVALRRIDRVHERCGGPEPGADLARMARAAGFSDLAEDAEARYGLEARDRDDEGEVVVFIQRGFVPHRTGGEVHVPVFADELDDLGSEGSGGMPALAALVGARAVASLAERERWGAAFQDRPGVGLGQALRGAHIVRITWPSLATPEFRGGALSLASESGSSRAVPSGNLARAVIRDFHRDGTGRMLRAVSRSLTRFVVSRDLERRAEDRGGEAAGAIAGFLSNVTLNAMDQPDLRSWSTLPAEISLVRLSIPAGEHDLALEGDAGAGGSLGTVSVSAGNRILLSRSIWSGADGPGAGRMAVLPD